MDERKHGSGTARKDNYTTPRHSFKMANGSQNNNSTLPSMEPERQKGCCRGFVEFLRHDHEYSLYCLSDTNPARRLSRLIVESKYPCKMVIYSLSNLPEKAELYFLIIFCIEAFLKIVAFGFVLHPGSYLRNGWNVLDFIVVLVGIFSLEQLDFLTRHKIDVKSLRAVRVLRPLKLISGVPSLQVVMKSIGRAMVPLLQIALLVLFVIVIYAIIGLEFLRKSFHDTCINIHTSKYQIWNIVTMTEAIPRPCDKLPYKGIREIIHGRECEHTNYTCGGNFVYWEGPNSGISTFDNIALSMITVFQCITMEGWTNVMYLTFDAIDTNGYLYSVYFVTLIVIGSFFMLNLVLGVLSGEFAKERERVETRRAFFKVRRQEQLEREVAGYIEWITKAEEVITKEQSRKDGSRSIVEPNESQAHVICNDLVINPMAVLTKPLGNGYRLNMPETQSRLDRFHLLESRVRISLRKAVKSQWFYWAVLICVFLNTVSLATEHYNQPRWLDDFQAGAELIFLAIFTLEMAVKMYSLGMRIYFSSSFNIFDCVVVCSGIVDTFLAYSIEINLGISVLRCLRLLRIFKVTRHWTSLRNLATSLVSSIKSIVSLLFLLFLFILISALLGMQIFGGKFSEPKTPRTNFDNFPNAMLTVFQILTGEDWNEVMYHGILSYGGPHDPAGVAVSLYFVLLVIVGNYTLLNVFLAIAVDNLANAQILTEDEENEEKERVRKRAEMREMYSVKAETPQPIANKRPSHWRKAKSIPKLLVFRNKLRENKEDLAEDMTDAERGKTDNKRFSQALGKKIELYRREDSLYSKKVNGQISDGDGNPASDENQGKIKRRVREQRGGRLGRGRGRTRGKSQSDGEGGKTDEGNEDDDDNITAHNFMRVLKTGRFGNRRRRTPKDVSIIKTRALFIFGPENGLRGLCHRIVCLAHFDTCMLIVIILSSLVIAVEDPVYDDAPKNKILWYFDCVFTAIFIFEVVVKVIDMGLIFHKGAYLRSIWNVIDGTVVACNLASLILSRSSNTDRLSNSAIRALRVMRVLRPFKSVHKIKKLRAVFRCMWFSVKNVVNILMITVLFLFIFAVMGVQLFNGKFSFCNDVSKLTKEKCKGQYFDYEEDGNGNVNMDNPKVISREWKTRVFNFDNVFNAMLTLYTSSTGEGWPTAMHRTMDTTEKNEGPIQDNSTPYAIYYVSFVVVFSFFFLNIFVALIILTFQDLGEKEISDCELDRNQRDCIHFALTAKPAQMYMPRNKKSVQYYVWMLVMSKPFDVFIMVSISLNTIVLMMQYRLQPTNYKDVCSYLNIAFTALFTVEAVLKLVALRLNYFRDYWNLFDFVVVIGGIIDILVTYLAKENIPIDPSMFRLFRAARLIKLLRQGYTIRILLWTFFRSFKALPYVTLLILLMFFMYAVIGMQLFGKIELREDTEINRFNNFRHILMAHQVLFRSATGENWHLVMRDCFHNATCDPSIPGLKEGELCGSKPLAVIYFCSFIFLCMFLMLNLFVAVIMDNFEYLTRDESILGPHHLEEFVRVWSEYDPTASGCIQHNEIYHMMCSMSPPVGFGKKCPKIVGYKRLIKMNMPVNEDGAVTFSTTLFALIRTSLNIKLKGNMNANDTDLRNLMKRLWPNTTQKKVLDKLIPKQSVLSSQQMTIGKIYCAKLIHENYKYSKRKAEGGIERGFLRKIVGSIRGYQDGSEHTPESGYPRNSNYLTAPSRPRSKTFDDSRGNTDHGTKTPSETSSYLHGNPNSVTRSRSWSSKANGDLEMIELKPVPSKNPRNGKPRTSDEGSNKPVVPLQYLTSSPKPDRTARNNSYSIAV
ncbi:hypothetical protein QZH41_016673, partial [Actinostola sp. cb2023]